MESLGPLSCVNRGELPPRSGLRFAIGVREGLEVATANGFVFGGWAGVVVGRHLERQAAIEQERRLASFPPQLGTSRSQGTRRNRHPGSPVCFQYASILPKWKPSKRPQI